MDRARGSHLEQGERAEVHEPELGGVFTPLQHQVTDGHQQRRHVALSQHERHELHMCERVRGGGGWGKRCGGQIGTRLGSDGAR